MKIANLWAVGLVSLPFAAQAQTEISWWHAMTGANSEVVEKIASGDVYTQRLTFPEGLTIAEMAKAYDSRGFGSTIGNGWRRILLSSLEGSGVTQIKIHNAQHELTTIEGLARDPLGERLQQAFVDCGAVQCGFCTPGMVVQAKNWLEAHPQATRAEIQRGIEGNLCRCTGYVKIVDAIEVAARQDA